MHTHACSTKKATHVPKPAQECAQVLPFKVKSTRHNNRYAPYWYHLDLKPPLVYLPLVLVDFDAGQNPARAQSPERCRAFEETE